MTPHRVAAACGFETLVMDDSYPRSTWHLRAIVLLAQWAFGFWVNRDGAPGNVREGFGLRVQSNVMSME